MPNIKSAKKRVKVIATKTLTNKMRKSVLKTTVTNLKDNIAKNSETINEDIKKAFKIIDRSAAKNVIHKNTAARKKSKLAKAINKANLNKESVNNTPKTNKKRA